MKAFFHAVFFSFRYKWSILGAVICSILIAVLWSASISTVFPIVKIVIEGQTAQVWIDKEIQTAATEKQSLEQKIAADVTAKKTLPPQEQVLLENKIDMAKDRLAGEEKAIARFKKLKPVIEKWAPTKPFDTLVLAMIWLLVTSILKGILLVLSAILVARVSGGTVMDMRRIYYRKALELDQKKIDRLGASNMMTHLSHNMLMVSGGLKMFYGKCLVEPLKMIACLAVAASISFPLLLLSLIVVPAGALIIHNVSRRMKRSTQSEMEGMSDVFQTLIETFKAIKTVRIFNRERTERRRFRRNAATLYRMQMRISFFDSMLRPITEVLGIISIALSILAGAYLVLNRETHLFGIQISQRPIDASMFVLFYTMLGGATDPARKMSEIVNVLIRGGTACENLYRVFDGQQSIGLPENPIAVPLHQSSIRFQDVSFAYQAKQPVLRRIDLEVPFGQKLAIVGGNGSGKSTMMNLLARFYDPNRGKILLDGHDIKQMNPKKLRRQIAWVTQDSVLFNGTLWENIAYGAKDATDEQILHAVEVARISDFVDQLTEGIHTNVGDDGCLLSAGQRQRVALARAVVANPRILILDEATSQMDGQTESLVHEAMNEFLDGRTTFIITHRASSLKLADRVIVMHLGKIVSDSSVQEAQENSTAFQFLFARKSA